MRLIPGLMVMACTTSMSCAGARVASGRDAAREQPERAAPGPWTEGEEVFGGSMTADEQAIYYSTRVGPGEAFRVFHSRRNGDGWEGAARVSFSDTTSDLYPSISRDGNRMVFTSYRRVPGDTSRSPNGHLWMTRRMGNRWEEPAPLNELNELGSYHPGTTMLADGSLYFRVVGRGRRALFRSAWTGSRYLTPKRIADFERLQSDTVRVWGGVPTPDERTFFLTVGRRTSPTAQWEPPDVFVSSVRPDGSWTSPRPLDSRVNTSEPEGAERVSPDGRYLYFTRAGRALYRFRIASALSLAR